MKRSPYLRRWLFVTLLFATFGLLILMLPLTSSAFALVITPTRRGPTATPNCSEMPCDMVSPPPGVRATRTPIFKLPTHTLAATRSPRNQPSATPNLDELGAPGTTGDNVRPLAGLSSLASISVAAGDVNGLANAVNVVNAGTADTISLNPGTYNMNGIGPFVFNTNVTIEGNGAIIEGGLTSQRVFSFRLGTVASIAHLTIRHAGGPNRSYGGAIGSRATLSIYDSVFDSNQALDGGGGDHQCWHTEHLPHHIHRQQRGQRRRDPEREGLPEHRLFPLFEQHGGHGIDPCRAWLQHQRPQEPLHGQHLDGLWRRGDLPPGRNAQYHL